MLGAAIVMFVLRVINKFWLKTNVDRSVSSREAMKKKKKHVNTLNSHSPKRYKCSFILSAFPFDFPAPRLLYVLWAFRIIL